MDASASCGERVCVVLLLVLLVAVAQQESLSAQFVLEMTEGLAAVRCQVFRKIDTSPGSQPRRNGVGAQVC